MGIGMDLVPFREGFPIKFIKAPGMRFQPIVHDCNKFGMNFVLMNLERLSLNQSREWSNALGPIEFSYRRV